MISAVFFKERQRKMIAEQVKPEPSGSAAPTAESTVDRQAGAARSARRDEYAATGMGQRTGHAVTEVWLNLEDAPAQSINIRYEFRPQLVRLGIVPQTRLTDRLQRREGARGFEPGFSPEPPRRR